MAFKQCGIVSVFMLIAFITAGECDCPKYWTPHGDSCYALVETAATWAEGAEICERMDGYLAEISSADESAFVKILAASKNLTVPRIWIGGQDLLSEGYWMWENSRLPFAYTDWCPGEPDDINSQDCVTVSNWKSDHCTWQWDDGDCGVKYNVLCELGLPTNPVG